MKIRILQTVVIVFAVAHCAGAAGMQGSKYIPYEATADEIATTNIAKKVVYDPTFEQPEGEMLKKRLQKALCMAESEESRIRHMLTKGMVRTNYWNKRYSGSVISKSEKAVYRFTFRSSKLDIQQMEKMVFLDKIYGERDRSAGYSFSFLHDSTDSVSSFSYGHDRTKVSLNFYPNYKLASCGLAIGDEYHRVRWDENGKLVSQTKTKLKEVTY